MAATVSFSLCKFLRTEKICGNSTVQQVGWLVGWLVV